MDTNNLDESDDWHIAVLVPARNEESSLPRCLHSIANARASLPAGVTSSVTVVSDSSTDQTYELACRLVGCGSVLRSNAECVGSARALAAKAALSSHCGDRRRFWLANTDADCEVPETWLIDQLRLARQGYAAVAGIVDVQDFSDHSPLVEQRFRNSYQIYSDGSHPHVHGANLGVRGDAYLLAGGWEALATAEDHDLWARLGAIGALRESVASIRVFTSGRRVGRAPLGFAQALAAHNDLVPA